MAWRQVVVFRVGGEEFAIDIKFCQRVVAACEVASLPEAPDWVAGVIGLRDKVLPVLDLRKKLGAPSCARAGSILVVKLFEQEVGLIVDSTSEVARFAADALEPVPDYITDLGVDWLVGVIRLERRVIALLDLEKVLARDQMCEFEEVVRLCRSL
jgi:purine-binding chemotaxis protein CheW